MLTAWNQSCLPVTDMATSLIAPQSIPQASLQPVYVAKRQPTGHFAPGSSGNPGGRRRVGIVSRALKTQLRTEIANGVRRVDVMADAVITRAETGDITSATFVRDTVEGRPASNDDRGNIGGITIAIQCSGNINLGE